MKWKDDFSDRKETSKSNDRPRAAELSSTNYLDKFAYNNNQSNQFDKISCQSISKGPNSTQVSSIHNHNGLNFWEVFKRLFYYLFESFDSNRTEPGTRKFQFKIPSDKQKVPLDPSQNPNKIDYYFNIKKREQSEVINKSEDQITPKESR